MNAYQIKKKKLIIRGQYYFYRLISIIFFTENRTYYLTSKLRKKISNKIVKNIEIYDNEKDLNIEEIRSKIGKSSFVFNCSLEHICCNGIGLSPVSELHVWKNSLTKLLDGRPVAEEAEQLMLFFKKFSPKSAAEFYGIETNSRRLIKNKITEVPLPWSTFVPTKFYDKLHKLGVINDALDQSHILVESDGWQQSGPMSLNKVTFELKRLLNIAHSIQKNGYIRSDGPDGDIIGRVLIEKENWKIIPHVGGHRIIVLSALNFKSIPIRIEYNSDWSIERLGNSVVAPNCYFGSSDYNTIHNNLLSGLTSPLYVEAFGKVFEDN